MEDDPSQLLKTFYSISVASKNNIVIYSLFFERLTFNNIK